MEAESRKVRVTIVFMMCPAHSTFKIKIRPWSAAAAPLTSMPWQTAHAFNRMFEGHMSEPRINTMWWMACDNSTSDSHRSPGCTASSADHNVDDLPFEITTGLHVSLSALITLNRCPGNS
jgi:hypothetical protein